MLLRRQAIHETIARMFRFALSLLASTLLIRLSLQLEIDGDRTWILLLRFGGIIVKKRVVTLTEFYQQISRRLRVQFRRGVRDVVSIAKGKILHYASFDQNV